MMWRMDAVLSFAKEFSLVFLPLFVAMSPLSVVPFLVMFLRDIPQERRGKVVRTALFTGLGIGLLFLALGRGIFSVLGIAVPDFLVAGGVVLLVIALKDLLAQGAQKPPAPDELLAVVPIGTPLLVGPATISILIVLSGLHSVWLVVAGFVANVLLAWLIFAQAPRIARVLGTGGLLALSKVTYLLLAAIAVQLIRQGLAEVLPGLLGKG
jgi:multiple antibiotic resistance protein